MLLHDPSTQDLALVQIAREEEIYDRQSQLQLGKISLSKPPHVRHSKAPPPPWPPACLPSNIIIITIVIATQPPRAAIATAATYLVQIDPAATAVIFR